MESGKAYRNLVAFDLDGTLLKKNCSFAFCKFLQKKRIFSSLDFFYCFRNYFFHRLGIVSLFDLHDKVFKRLLFLKRKEDLSIFIPEFIETCLDSMIYSPALECLRMYQKNGDHVIILTSSPTFLVTPIAKRFKVDEVYGTDYEIDNQGSLCKLANLLDGQAKVEILLRRADELNLNHTCAYTDSIIDLPLLEAARMPVAVNPERRLRKVARRRGWQIL